MYYKTWVSVFLIFYVFVTTASAVEIYVPPGDGTLAEAIANAADGDTLLLGEGTFSGYVGIDRSLTIRPVNSTTYALITGAVFTFTNGFTGLLIGYYADKINRKWMLFACAIGWNFFSLMISFTQTFW